MNGFAVLAATSDNVSLWVTLGLPVILVAITTLGAVGVAWTSGNRSREADRRGFLASERRHAYASHVAALVRAREVYAEVLLDTFRLDELTDADRSRLLRATSDCEVASNEALLLGTNEYVEASRKALEAINKLQLEVIRIDGRSRGLGSNMEPTTPEDLTTMLTEAGIDEIDAMRAVARSDLQA